MTRLLIVEDDEKIRASLLLQLREEGYAPQAMSSAEEALAHLEEPRTALPDLILLDVRMRGMSGVDLVRKLAEAKRFPPTIIISGEASISETVEALRLGVHDFIEKPFSRERLLQSIRNALEHHALKREVATLKADLRGEPPILGASSARTAVAEAAQTNGSMPTSVTLDSQTGNWTASTAYASGVITATANSREPAISSSNIVLNGTFQTQNGQVLWACTGSILSKYRPSTCQG